MSSQLTNLVPVLDGTNYQQWSAAMQSFLMSQGQWKCTKEGAEAPNTTTTTREVEGGPSVSVTVGKEEVASWNEDAEMALGNIRLHLHHTIGYQFNDVNSLSTLWETLKAKYGPVGLTHAFVEFKAIMDTTIPNGVDLVPAVRATLPSALNVINASSVGKLVQLVTASRLTLNHEGRVNPMKDECHYQIKH